MDMQEQLTNIDAERAVIGGILINPESYYEAKLHVGYDDFHVHLYRWLFIAIGNLHELGKDVDIITVQAELNRMDKHIDAHEITAIVSHVPSSLHVESYAKEVESLSKRRRLAFSAEVIAKIAFDMTEEPNIGEVMEDVYEAVRTRGKSARPWQDSLEAFEADLQERVLNPRDDVWGMSYGNRFAGLDRLTGGAQTAEFCIIAGKPGAGKSVIVADWIAEWSKHSWGVVYSMEMPDDVWIRRHVARESYVPVRDLQRGTIQDDWAGVKVALGELKKRKVILSDCEDWKSEELRADLTRLKQRHNIQWAVIDHLGLLSDVSESDITQSKVVAQRIRKAARGLDIHIVGISAVTKDGFDGGYPTMKNVRGSGEVLHEADLVFWLNDFTPMNSADRLALDSMTGEEKWKAKERMRTFFILKGRHLEGSNLKYKHLAFAEGRPTLAETTFPKEE